MLADELTVTPSFFFLFFFLGIGRHSGLFPFRGIGFEARRPYYLHFFPFLPPPLPALGSSARRPLGEIADQGSGTPPPFPFYLFPLFSGSALFVEKGKSRVRRRSGPLPLFPFFFLSQSAIIDKEEMQRRSMVPFPISSSLLAGAENDRFGRQDRRPSPVFLFFP